MSVEILKLTLGPLQTNCYIVGDTQSGDAFVIDPSDRADLILRAVEERAWTVRCILATHGHFDHVLASAELKKATGAPFRLHERDVPQLRFMTQRVKEWIGITVAPAADPDGLLNEGDVISAGAISLEVLHTPGHSPGHVSLVLRSEKTVFSGDCLFYCGVGRSDLPGSNYAVLMESIVHKLLPLGDDFAVATGHLRNTTIGYEREHNTYIADYFNANPA